MSITLKLTFLAGRYHATPWGRHVNEGAPEWPPSPWRLLRAIIAVWQRTRPDLPESQIRRMLEPLLPAPLFRLPDHRVAHTRHYMPWEKKGPEDRTLVFDTFVVVGRSVSPSVGSPNATHRRSVSDQQLSEPDPLFVGWPNADLTDEDRAVLTTLLGNLSSLGRAEAWVHAELADESVAWNCGPAPADDSDPVPVLCADPLTAFGSEHYPKHDPKKLKRGLALHERLFDCPRWHLCLDTQTIHEERWPRVPGTAWVNYTRPVETGIMSGSNVTHRPPGTLARLSLDGTVLPLVGEGLHVAESVRAGLLNECKAILARKVTTGGIELLPHRDAPALYGKDEDRQPLKGHHHAFFLPEDDDDDGRIDHLTVLAPMGFNLLERAALERLRATRIGDDGLSLLLVGLGDVANFLPTRILGPATVWESATPFLVTRHLKRRGQKRDPKEFCEGPEGHTRFVGHVLREELDRRGFPGCTIEPIDVTGGSRRLRPLQFRLYRRKPGDDGGSRPRGLFRLRFPTPVAGPITLGHSCHFGLGLFHAIE